MIYYFNFYTYLNTEFINKVQSDINEINDLVVKLNTKILHQKQIMHIID